MVRSQLGLEDPERPLEAGCSDIGPTLSGRENAEIGQVLCDHGVIPTEEGLVDLGRALQRSFGFTEIPESGLDGRQIEVHVGHASVLGPDVQRLQLHGALQARDRPGQVTADSTIGCQQHQRSNGLGAALAEMCRLELMGLLHQRDRLGVQTHLFVDNADGRQELGSGQRLLNELVADALRPSLEDLLRAEGCTSRSIRVRLLEEVHQKGGNLSGRLGFPVGAFGFL